MAVLWCVSFMLLFSVFIFLYNLLQISVVFLLDTIMTIKIELLCARTLFTDILLLIITQKKPDRIPPSQRELY